MFRQGASVRWGSRRLGMAAGGVLLAGAGLAGCAPSSEPPRPPAGMRGASSATFLDADPGRNAAPRALPRGGGHYKIGAPYQIGGRWYVPRVDPHYDRVGVASWYGADFHGRPTANGEFYDMHALTAAHPTLPLPSYVSVTNLDNGRMLLVRVNDRGPYTGDRIIDLSRETARLLGLERQGTGRVRVRYAGAAPLDGNDTRERAFLASQSWNTRGRGVASSEGPQLVSVPRLVRSGRSSEQWVGPAYGLGGWSALEYRGGR